MQDILVNLPLDADLTGALLTHAGPMGEILSCVLAGEHGDWSGASTLGIAEERASELLVGAISWTEANSTALVAKSQ